MHTRSITTIISALLSTTAVANDALEEAPSNALDVITVIGSELAEFDLPGSGEYLDETQINQHNSANINNVLRQVPGVYVREEDGHGLFPNISLRGVDGGRSAKVTLMEDGIPTAPAPYAAPSAYYSPNIARMQGLEVLKGSSQVRHGPHITGGVINYLSTAIPGSAKGKLKTTFGSDNDLRAHAWYGNTVNTSIGSIGFLVEGYARQTDGFKTIDETPDFAGKDAEATGFTQTEPMVKLAFEPNSDTYQRIELKHGRSDLDADETYLGTSETDFRANPQRRYAASRFDNIKTEHQHSSLSYLISATDNLDLTATAYYQKFARNWFKIRRVNGNSLSAALAGANNGDDLATLKGDAAGTLGYRNNNRSYYAKGVQLAADYSFATGDISHELHAGLRHHQDSVRRFQNNETFTQDANGSITDRDIGTPGTAGNRKQTVKALALNVEDRMQIGRLQLTPGVRVEQLDLDFQDFGSDPADPSDDSAGQDDLTVFAGGVSALYEVNDHWRAFGGIHRGYSTPAPRAYIRNDIQEETSLALEAGARYNSGNGLLSGEVAVFHTRFDDLIVSDNVGGAGGGNGDTESVGEVTTTGVEMQVEYDAARPLKLMLDMPLSLTATYTNAEITNAASSTDAESIFSGAANGNELPYVPEWQLTASAGVGNEKWQANLSATYVASTFATASNTDQQLNPSGSPDARYGKTDSYTVVNLSGNIQLTNTVKVGAGINNLLDKEYLVSRLPEGPRAGAPRTAYMTMEIDF